MTSLYFSAHHYPSSAIVSEPLMVIELLGRPRASSGCGERWARQTLIARRSTTDMN